MSINQKDYFQTFFEFSRSGGGTFFSRSFSVFMKVMEEKKFSAAAVKLQLTQSSISQTIAGLESLWEWTCLTEKAGLPNRQKKRSNLRGAQRKRKERKPNLSQYSV